MTKRLSRPLYDAPDAVIRDAADWLARRDRGLTPAEESEFESWRKSEPTHAAAVAQIERAFIKFDDLRRIEPQTGEEPDPDFFAPKKRRSHARFYFVGVGLAAAAAVVAVFFLKPSVAPRAAHWKYATGAEEYNHITLVDGSIVDLNSETQIEVEYSSETRRVRLRQGAARFEVAKNPRRPFIVQANGLAVRAVGTAFNVRLSPAQVEVLVTEGKVHVEHSAFDGESHSGAATASKQAEIPIVTAGHRIVVSTDSPFAAPRISPVGSSELAQASVWRSSVAEFDNRPLEEIVAKFNAYNRQKLVIDGPALSLLRIGGSFRLDQPEAFARLLESSFGVTTSRSGNTITLRAAH